MGRTYQRIGRLASGAMRTLAGIVATSAERRSRGGQTDVIAPVNRAVATNIASPGSHRVAVERQWVTVEQRGPGSDAQAPPDDAGRS